MMDGRAEMPISNALNRRERCWSQRLYTCCWDEKLHRYAHWASAPGHSLRRPRSAQDGPLVLERAGRTIALEPYAPNILRVSMSIDRAAATAAPGYGFVAKPSAEGWTHRARRRRLRCVPIGQHGRAPGAGRSSQGQAAAADAARPAESGAAPPIFWWRRREWSERRRPRSAQ